jgi:hypothetical protein
MFIDRMKCVYISQFVIPCLFLCGLQVPVPSGFVVKEEPREIPEMNAEDLVMEEALVAASERLRLMCNPVSCVAYLVFFFLNVFLVFFCLFVCVFVCV